jgi:hypothetical protein
MIKSIVYEYHWTPEVISNLYVDDLDFKGIVYWYEELRRIDKEMKNNK